MYVSTANPNQVVATALGYQSSATAFPVSIRPGTHGNTVTYSFNPLLNQSIAWNPNPLFSSAAVSPMFNQQLAWNVNPMMTTTGMSAWSPAVQPLTYAFLPASNIASNWELVANPSLGLTTSPVQFINPMNFNTIQSCGMAQMRVDLHETNSDVVVVAELPNVNLNDLNLTVTDDSLSISATAFAGNRATSLFRSVALPTSIKAEQVEATYSNGILEIRAPKSDVTTRRKVKVNIA